MNASIGPLSRAPSGIAGVNPAGTGSSYGFHTSRRGPCSAVRARAKYEVCENTALNRTTAYPQQERSGRPGQELLPEEMRRSRSNLKRLRRRSSGPGGTDGPLLRPSVCLISGDTSDYCLNISTKSQRVPGAAGSSWSHRRYYGGANVRSANRLNVAYSTPGATSPHSILARERHQAGAGCTRTGGSSSRM